MIKVGQTPIGFRQESAAKFTGVAPENAGGTEFKPFVNPETRVVQYVDENDQAETVLAQGGLFDFGPETVKIREIRGLAASGDISVIVSDEDGTHPVAVGTPAAAQLIFHPALVILPSQVLKVSTAAANAAGWIDVYAVKGDWY
jgi:hypothetical protein